MLPTHKLPVGLFCRRRRACAVGQISGFDWRVPRPTKRGASRSSRVLARDAMDAMRAATRRGLRTAKSCGPDPPTLESSLQVMILQATVANKPGTPRRTRISRKPIAQGMPDCLGCPVVACVRQSAFSWHARLAGAVSIRHSLRPLSFEGRCSYKTRADRAAGMRKLVSVS